ncbi:MAG: type 1 glutamine amidotransferase [Phycisphaerae bacterium]
MQIAVLQHVPFEDAANIGLWAEKRGHGLAATHLYLGQQPPELDRFEMLAIMGGPMNIYQHDQHSWLETEKQYIARAIEAGKAVLGICLGAQLIADVLGGPVTKNPCREIGWFEVDQAEGTNGSLLAELPPRFTAFHWHGDRFAIPPGATRLAGSEACDNQAFQYGDRVLGMQFHLDYQPASIENMLTHCADELDGTTWVQSADDIRAYLRSTTRTQAYLEQILGRIERLVG